MLPDKHASDSTLDTRISSAEDNVDLDEHQLAIKEHMHFIDQTHYLKPFPSQMIENALTKAIHENNTHNEIITKIIEKIKDRLYYHRELQIQNYVECKFGFNRKTINVPKLKAYIEEILPLVMVELLDELHSNATESAHKVFKSYTTPEEVPEFTEDKLKDTFKWLIENDKYWIQDLFTYIPRELVHVVQGKQFDTAMVEEFLDAAILKMVQILYSWKENDCIQKLQSHFHNVQGDLEPCEDQNDLFDGQQVLLLDDNGFDFHAGTLEIFTKKKQKLYKVEDDYTGDVLTTYDWTQIYPDDGINHEIFKYQQSLRNDCNDYYKRKMEQIKQKKSNAPPPPPPPLPQQQQVHQVKKNMMKKSLPVPVIERAKSTPLPVPVFNPPPLEQVQRSNEITTTLNPEDIEVESDYEIFEHFDVF